MSEAYLGYTPITNAAEQSGELNLQTLDQRADKAVEEADLALHLRGVLEPQLKEKQQEKVFYEIETDLLPALVEMEFEGIRVDAKALEDFGIQLGKEMAACEGEIYQLAGGKFNLNSPKQLGEVLFERLKLMEKAKKNKNGPIRHEQQTLQELAGDHQIVKRILDYRGSSKLKSTYVDTLRGQSGRARTASTPVSAKPALPRAVSLPIIQTFKTFPYAVSRGVKSGKLSCRAIKIICSSRRIIPKSNCGSLPL